MYFIITCFVFAVFLFIFGYYSTITYNHWADRNVPYKKPVPLLGNFARTLMLKKSFAYAMKELYDEFHDEPYVGVFQATRPMLMLKDPELIKAVLVTDFHIFSNRLSVNTDTRREPLLRNLFNMKGNEWKEFRCKLTPTFSTAKLKAMFPLIENCAGELCSVLRQDIALGDDTNVSELMARYTTDVLGCCAFGLRVNSIRDPESPFRVMGKKIFSPSKVNIGKRFCRALFPLLYKTLNLKTFTEDVETFFTDVMRQVLTERRMSLATRNDFVELMMKIQECENDASVENKLHVTDELITSNSFIFLLAGLETTSTTMGFCLYEIAKDIQIQNRIMSSVDKAIEQHGSLTYDAVNGLAYLSRVIHEAMRKHPPSPMISRICEETYRLPGTEVTLKPGECVLIPIYALHHDSRHYSNTDVFDPDRFTENGKNTRHPYTFLPLGEGPRNCIGSRFAHLTIATALATLFSKYTVSPCGRTTPDIRYDPRSLLLKNNGGVWLRLQTR